MIVTSTAVSFSFLGIGLALLGFQFLRAHKINPKVFSGLLLSIYFFASALQNGLLAVGGFLFGKTPEKMYFVMIVDHLFLTMVATIATYTFFFFVCPKISPWIGVRIIFLFGLIVIGATVVTHPMPKISGIGIDWNFTSSLSLLVNILLFVAITPIFIIFWKLFNHTKKVGTKILMLIVSAVAAIGIVNALLRFVILDNNDPSMRTLVFDLGIGFMGVLFILITLFLPVINKWNSFTSTEPKTEAYK